MNKVQELRKMWDDSDWTADYSAMTRASNGQSELPHWFLRLVSLKVDLLGRLREWALCRNGHDVVELDGNAETGSFYGKCSRCGCDVHGYW